MCFSATASFAGGAALTLIGTASMIHNKKPRQRLFSAMPFVFGLQQISEGFVWTGLQTAGGDNLARLAAHVFLVAALVIWPAFVPISVLLLEPSGRRRQTVLLLAGIGVVASLAYATGLVLFDVHVDINRYHVFYSTSAPRAVSIVFYVIYLVVTILPLLLTSNRRIHLLGAAVAVSYLVAFFFYQEHLVSVWCFFAAVCSVVVLWIVTGSRSVIKAQPAE